MRHGQSVRGAGEVVVEWDHVMVLTSRLAWCLAGGMGSRASFVKRALLF